MLNRLDVPFGLFLLLSTAPPPPAMGVSCPGGEFGAVGDKYYYAASDAQWASAHTKCPADTELATFENQQEFDQLAGWAGTSESVPIYMGSSPTRQPSSTACNVFDLVKMLGPMLVYAYVDMPLELSLTPPVNDPCFFFPGSR